MCSREPHACGLLLLMIRLQTHDSSDDCRHPRLPPVQRRTGACCSRLHVSVIDREVVAPCFWICVFLCLFLPTKLRLAMCFHFLHFFPAFVLVSSLSQKLIPAKDHKRRSVSSRIDCINERERENTIALRLRPPLVLSYADPRLVSLSHSL